MSVYKEALDLINRGRMGKNEGLSIGMPRLSYYVPGIQQGNIYLIGGVTASGKSALAMSSFAYNPYEDWRARRRESEISLKIMIWSLEISREMLMTKSICRRIFLDYGILTDINYVLSRGKNRVSDEIYRLVAGYARYYEEFEDVVSIFGPDNPTGIRNTLLKYLRENGEVKTKVIQKTAENGVRTTESIPDRYIPKTENTYVIAIVDHLNILKTERGYNKKQNIDKLMEYMVEMSNFYKISPVLVQQINRNVEHIDRQKANSIDVMIGDFKETGDTTDAAHYIMALNYPWRWEISNYRGYKTKELGDRARFLSILKNRDGDANAYIGLQFVGEVGAFKELPKSDLMTNADYQIIQSLKKHQDVTAKPIIQSSSVTHSPNKTDVAEPKKTDPLQSS